MVNKNYLVIQGWMRTELDLKGNDLLVYALIYGFSQTEGQAFTGSLQYMADWCGATKQGISKNLKSLINRGLIQKKQLIKNGVKFCEYSCIVGNLVSQGVQLSFPNNIVDNKVKNNISINRNITSLVKNKSLYEKCSDVIKTYDFSKELERLIYDYLSLRLKIIDNPIYNIKQGQGILNKLTKDLAPDDEDMQIQIVRQSIEKGYASFYPVNIQTRSQRQKAHNRELSCEQYTKEEEEEIRKWQKEVVKNGGRIKF